MITWALRLVLLILTTINNYGETSPLRQDSRPTFVNPTTFPNQNQNSQSHLDFVDHSNIPKNKIAQHGKYKQSASSKQNSQTDLPRLIKSKTQHSSLTSTPTYTKQKDPDNLDIDHDYEEYAYEENKETQKIDSSVISQIKHDKTKNGNINAQNEKEPVNQIQPTANDTEYDYEEKNDNKANSYFQDYEPVPEPFNKDYNKQLHQESIQNENINTHLKDNEPVSQKDTSQLKHKADYFYLDDDIKAKGKALSNKNSYNTQEHKWSRRYTTLQPNSKNKNIKDKFSDYEDRKSSQYPEVTELNKDKEPIIRHESKEIFKNLENLDNPDLNSLSNKIKKKNRKGKQEDKLDLSIQDGEDDYKIGLDSDSEGLTLENNQENFNATTIIEVHPSKLDSAKPIQYNKQKYRKDIDLNEKDSDEGLTLENNQENFNTTTIIKVHPNKSDSVKPIQYIKQKYRKNDIDLKEKDSEGTTLENNQENLNATTIIKALPSKLDSVKPIQYNKQKFRKDDIDLKEKEQVDLDKTTSTNVEVYIEETKHIEEEKEDIVKNNMDASYEKNETSQTYFNNNPIEESGLPPGSSENIIDDSADKPDISQDTNYQFKISEKQQTEMQEKECDKNIKTEHLNELNAANGLNSEIKQDNLQADQSQTDKPLLQDSDNNIDDSLVRIISFDIETNKKGQIKFSGNLANEGSLRAITAALL